MYHWASFFHPRLTWMYLVEALFWFIKGCVYLAIVHKFCLTGPLLFTDVCFPNILILTYSQLVNEWSLDTMATKEAGILGLINRNRICVAGIGGDREFWNIKPMGNIIRIGSTSVFLGTFVVAFKWYLDVRLTVTPSVSKLLFQTFTYNIL